MLKGTLIKTRLVTIAWPHSEEPMQPDFPGAPPQGRILRLFNQILKEQYHTGLTDMVKTEKVISEILASPKPAIM
jgi:hypothetical protein